MKKEQLLSLALLVNIIIWPSASIADPLPLEDGADAMGEAMQEYNAGHYDNAVSLLMQEIKKNPDSGRAHYYLGSALKKVGADANAIHELEMAIKYCPAGTLQGLAKEALHGDFKDDDAAPTAAQTSPPSLFSGLFAFFQPPGSQSSSGPSTSFFPMPDFHPFSDVIKNAKKWAKSQNNHPGGSPVSAPIAGVVPPPASEGQLQKDGTDIIPMAEMLRIAEESKKLNPKAQSHPDGVMRFPQAPENNLAWSAWIQRFRKTFNNSLFRRLATNVKDETRGAVSVIFSVDKQGHLRGCVYTANADDTVTQCVLDTVRELDKSYFLAFPPDSHVTGWNFRMKWNFARALYTIQYLRMRKAEALAAINKIDQEKVAAELLKAKNAKAERAKAEKLAIKAPPPPVVKTGVSGQILTKAKPEELKAVQLKLSDMPPLTDQEVNDLKIMRSDGDSSPLFQ